MIKSVQIEAFRGVREGRVEGLSPLSILVGPNNSGKSTLLEAAAVVGLGDRADRSVKILLRRGGPPRDALRHIINGADIAKIFVDCAEGDNKSVQWVTSLFKVAPLPLSELQEARAQGLREPLDIIVLQFKSDQLVASDVRVYWDAKGRCSRPFVDHGGPLRPFLVRLIDIEAIRSAGALEESYSQLERGGRIGTVIDALKKSMPTLAGLKILKADSDFVLYTVHEKGKPIPAYVAGDGFKRFLELSSAVLAEPKGVVLLEEPEAYQHPRYLQDLASLLLMAAKAGTQIILSTHSIELIDLLLHSPHAGGTDFPTVHRMRLVDGKLRATAVDRASAIVARDDLLEDLRA